MRCSTDQRWFLLSLVSTFTYFHNVRFSWSGLSPAVGLDSEEQGQTFSNVMKPK